ncbi:hypothetical protein VSH64_45255 [Amycolatopsis rhabdoformis]|uniref:Uncharacterized protein n=1 Tax=Amycolatopsis rhabdoformis TaxID=1448059 RepID=A0ABZ1I6D4_9PSEU|nr:hypothetical protein [Amycolatopsis rhabdoformis]WSE29925.1 hypothetical protein VSH64_45255 [Amycolatopsis rhabdoformis]
MGESAVAPATVSRKSFYDNYFSDGADAGEQAGGVVQAKVFSARNQ